MTAFRVLAAATAMAAAFTPAVEAAVPLTDVASVAAGGAHTCAVTTAGGAICWGRNYYGQLGDGTTADSAVPVDVTGLTSGVVAIAAGSSHTCAVMTDGGVKCWGWNLYGQLGNGTTADSLVPVDVVGSTSGMATIAAGEKHTCALTMTGGVKCWGRNWDGQLGNGTNVDSSIPVDVTGLSSGITAIATGGWHSCAVTADGGAKCWGLNGHGELGNGTTTNALTPADVTGLTSGVAAIAGGRYHSCALTTFGGVKCWGYNASGQLGSDTGATALTPTDVTGLPSGVASIAAGGEHSCALTTVGGVKCWGFNLYGQLGDGTTANAPAPVDVTGLTSGNASIATGYAHSCGLTASGGTTCWGNNYSGQLGNGVATSALTAVSVAGLSSGAAAVATGALHSCAVTSTGGAKCWGGNTYGQLGNGTTASSSTPVDVSGLTAGVANVAPGFLHTCALTTTGGAKCWGSNNQGQLGNGTTSGELVPVDVNGLASGVAAIGAAGHHTCALTTAGGVKCWGWMTLVPADVIGLTSGIAAIAVGGHHTCALTSAGGVKCWGSNFHGQLGDGTGTDSSVPVDVAGLDSGVVAIAAGTYHSCALMVAGGVKCWGLNSAGQLGNGTTTNALTPSGVIGLATSIAAISGGEFHTCALTATGGGVKCWGANSFGQLGDGTATASLTPSDVSGLASGAVVVATGAWHTCALTSPLGAAKCWGFSAAGQLGNGIGDSFATPRVVVAPSCADFTDVSPTSAFCPSVEWLRNRAVTLGCTTPNDFCPIDPVSRLAMAAFMNRLGTALAHPVATKQETAGALDPDTDPVVCTTADWSPSGFPRRVYADGVFAATATGNVDVSVEPVASPDGGTNWYALTTQPARALIRGSHWSSVRVLGGLDADVGLTLRFGLRVGRGGAAGGGMLADSTCNLRLRIDSRNAALSPF